MDRKSENREMETVQQQEDLSITVEDVRSVLRKVSKWKAAGPSGFGLKTFRTCMKE